MISEIIISFTLFLNAGAVLNFNLRRKTDDFIDHSANASFGEKVRDFFETLKYFRGFIGLWNIVTMFLMITFFGS